MIKGLSPLHLPDGGWNLYGSEHFKGCMDSKEKIPLTPEINCAAKWTGSMFSSVQHQNQYLETGTAHTQKEREGVEGQIQETERPRKQDGFWIAILLTGYIVIDLPIAKSFEADMLVWITLDGFILIVWTENLLYQQFYHSELKCWGSHPIYLSDFKSTDSAQLY